MEVIVKNAPEFPIGSIVSVRCGGTRRQAAVTALRDHTLKFPPIRGEVSNEPLRIDILKPICKQELLVLAPKQEDYTVSLHDEEGIRLQPDCEISVRSIGARPVKEPSPAATEKFEESAKSAQGYLEDHKLLAYFQSLLHACLQTKPEDPYLFMWQQIGNINGIRGGESSEATSLNEAAMKEPLKQMQQAEQMRLELAKQLADLTSRVETLHQPCEAATSCVCGNIFLADAEFCRKCGIPRPKLALKDPSLPRPPSLPPPLPPRPPSPPTKDTHAEAHGQVERAEDEKKWQAQLEQLDVAEELRQKLDSMVVDLTERVKALSQEMARKSAEVELLENQHKEEAEELKRLRSSWDEVVELRIELGKQKIVADEASAELVSQAEKHNKSEEEAAAKLRSQAETHKNSIDEAAAELKIQFETHKKSAEDKLAELKSQLEQHRKAADEARSQLEQHKKAADEAAADLRSKWEKIKPSASEIVELRSQLEKPKDAVDEDSLRKLDQAEASRKELEQRVADLMERLNARAPKLGESAAPSAEHAWTAKLHSASADELRGAIAGLTANEHQKLKKALGPDIIVSEEGLQAFDKAEEQREGLQKRVAELTEKLAAMERRTTAETDSERLTREPELKRQLHEAEQKGKELSERVEKLPAMEAAEVELKQQLAEAEQKGEELTQRVTTLAKRVGELMATSPTTETASGDAAPKVDEATLGKLKQSEELGKALEKQVAELHGSIEALKAANRDPSPQVPAAEPGAIDAEAACTVEAGAVKRLEDAEGKREELARSVAQLREKLTAMDASEAASAQELAEAKQKLAKKEETETVLKRQLQEAEQKVEQLAEREGSLVKAANRKPSSEVPAASPGAIDSEAASTVEAAAVKQLGDAEVKREELARSVDQLRERVTAMAATEGASAQKLAEAEQKGEQLQDRVAKLTQRLQDLLQKRPTDGAPNADTARQGNAQDAPELLEATLGQLTDAEMKREALESRLSDLSNRVKELQACAEGSAEAKQSAAIAPEERGAENSAPTKQGAPAQVAEKVVAAEQKDAAAVAKSAASTAAQAAAAPDAMAPTTAATTATASAAATAAATATTSGTTTTAPQSLPPPDTATTSPPQPLQPTTATASLTNTDVGGIAPVAPAVPDTAQAASMPSIAPVACVPSIAPVASAEKVSSIDIQAATPVAPAPLKDVQAPGIAPPPLPVTATPGTSAAVADRAAATAATGASGNSPMRGDQIAQPVDNGDFKAAPAKVEELAKNQAAPNNSKLSGAEEEELRFAKIRIKEAVGQSLASGVLEDALTRMLQDTEPAKMRIKEHVESALESGKLDEELARVAAQGPPVQQDINDLKAKLKIALENNASSGGLTGLLAGHDYGVASS